MDELSFGEWLKRQRNGRGLTQEQLAQQIGCATITLRKIESEDRRPSAQIVERLSEIFNIPQKEQTAFLRFARGDWRSAPGEVIEDAPWHASTTSPRSNLPTSLTSLIGRGSDIAVVREYLSSVDIRLINLIGPPGIGKTRLSVEVAHEVLHDFPDGVFFVALAPLEDPSLIAPTIVQALGFVERKNQPFLKRLQDGIGDKQMLIVLDNVEHLIQVTATLVSDLLSACPRLKILTTSREALRVPGEWLYPVPTLNVPTETQLQSMNIEEGPKYAALTLFAERARAVRPDFTLNTDNIRAVTAICIQLDGLPLAIELISARVRLMSAQTLLAKLNDQFVLSADGMRAVPARQKTLHNAISWSYNLLSHEEQKLFRRLSVFVNGWTLEAAEAVCSHADATVGDGLKREEILELLTQLVNKSLVLTEERNGEVRYRLLETIGQFGNNKLVEADESEVLRDHHLDFFIQVAETADSLLRSAAEIEWLQRLDDERDNLYAALQWTASKHSAEPALRLAGALVVYWTMRSFWLEGAKWLDSALKKASFQLEEMKSIEKALYRDAISLQNLHDHQKQRARWHSRLAFIHYGLGSVSVSSEHAQEALRLLGRPIPTSSAQFIFGLFWQISQQALHHFFPSRFVGIVSNEKERYMVIEVARLYELMGKIYFHTNENLPIAYTVLRLLNEAEKAGTFPELALAYSSMSVLMGFAQLHCLTETYVDRSIAVAEEVNQPSNVVAVSVMTSLYKITVGKWEEVRTRMEKARAVCEQLGDYRQWSDCAVMLGQSALMAGDIQYAMNINKILLKDAHRRSQYPLHQCWGLVGVGVNNIRLGQSKAAVPMLEDALQILEDIPNLASSIETNGQLALAYLRLGEEEKALASADKVLELAANLSPTVYSMNIGFAATADVYFELWQKSFQDLGRQSDSDKYKWSAEKAVKLLYAFQRVFPIGQPTARHYEGWRKWLMGKPRAAIKSWKKGLEGAKKFKMPYEEGLIHLKLGNYLQEDPNKCREHFERAIQIFEKMGAMHELNVAKMETKNRGF